MNYKEHYDRVRDGANNVFSLSNLSSYIETKTKLDGKPFSFEDHEYQRDIIDNPAKTLFVSKCAQVGLSEIFARWGTAAVATQKNFTLIWTFPTTTDSEKFCKARLDPFIDSSPDLARLVSKHVNSTDLKKFGDNSFMYIRGTISETGALSVPANLLIHDEYDRSDMANIAAYVSRLQHKPTKMRRIFSTPTVNKYGISLASETTKRKRQMWKCSHCGHHFLPSYEDNIVIPGYDGPKKEITKSSIRNINYMMAKLICLKCGKEPSTELKYRQWVVENPQDNFEGVTYFVAPFCLPRYLTPQYMVKASTEFDRWSEFVNQTLGLPEDDNDESLTEPDIRSCLVRNVDFRSTDVHYMGADMGLICHITISKLTAENLFVPVYREKVTAGNFERRRIELIQQYKVVNSVHDAFPYTDMIQRITEYDPTAYGAVYVTSKSTASHTVQEVDEELEEGRLNLRRLNINRSVALDELMYKFKRREVVLATTGEEDEDELVTHLRDMKRVQKIDKVHGGKIYVWMKTQGNDHWHHSLLYSLMATKMRGVYAGVMDEAPSLVTRIQVKSLTSRRNSPSMLYPTGAL